MSSTQNSLPAQSLSNTKIKLTKRYFRDDHGRIIQMRGVNLGGNSKLPTSPFALSPSRPEFYNHRNVSFINRPFPIDQAHTHFQKLHHWGFTFIRLLVPWEAIEHSGPGKYDEDYINYIKQIILIAHQYHIVVFIDPHQDTFSRYSGGSGAPGWVFECVGMNVVNFEACGAAILHELSSAIDPITGEIIPDRHSRDTLNFTSNNESSQMLWPTNASKLASATLFTLFFAGNTFAPNCKIEGINVQTYLQTHYCKAYSHLAQQLQDCPNIIGFEVMNEPHMGYIQMSTLHELNYYDHLMLGECPSPLQQFALGMGVPCQVDLYMKSWPYPSKKVGQTLLNANQSKAWLPNYECIWKQQGVWDMVNGKPALLKPDYFYKHPVTGIKVNFNQDFYAPFIELYAKTIHEVNSNLFIYFEPIPGHVSPKFESHVPNLVYAPHWYELQSVFNKKFKGYITFDVPGIRSGESIFSSMYFGMGGAKLNFHQQIKNLVKEGDSNSIPTIVGECGIPFDMNNKEILQGHVKNHCKFLDAILYAMESNFTHFTYFKII
eukprot:NODE_199_length_13192_cov_0.539219.p1 type:complete len:547 gc:universal NODE_199_length_13192_cov_0.539219:9310-7670(-)